MMSYRISKIIPAQWCHTTEYVPAGQGMHLSDESCAVFEEYVPALQSKQVESLVARRCDEYVPAGQGIQLLLYFKPQAEE